MELIKIFGILSLSIILMIVLNVSAKVPTTPPTVKPNMEFIKEIRTNLYSGYSACKEELELPGSNFSEFRKEIIADKVDGNTVGCALTCMATKASYVKENHIDETKLKNDVNMAFNFENPLVDNFKTTVDKCTAKTNIQFSNDSCKLIKGLFGCIMTDFQNGTIGKLIMTLSSMNRRTLYSKFIEL